MLTSQLLIIIGIALTGMAIIGFVVYLLIAQKSKKKLEKQLIAEYGEKRN